MSSFDDRHDDAREQRLAAQDAAAQHVERATPPGDVSAVAYWKHMRSLTDERYWAAIEHWRDTGTEWDAIATQLETTTDSIRTQYHARRRRPNKSDPD